MRSEELGTTREGSGPGDPEARRLWALVDAGVFMSGDLQLDAVLDRICQTAAGVIGARYAAIGVLDESGEGLSNFVFHGLSQWDRERIGHLPVGRGLLGALITDPRPIRLADLSADQRSVGFPEHHPPMRSFLGVPILARGRVFGNLYLTEKDGGEEFTEEDERLALALAGQAGVAVENARLFEAAQAGERMVRRRLEELESIQRVGATLMTEFDPARVLRMIALSARDLAGARTAMVAMRKNGTDALQIRVAVGERAGAVEGATVPVEGSYSALSMKARETVLVGDLLDDERAHSPIAERVNARAAIFAPLLVGEEAVGTLAVTHDEPGHFGTDDLYVVQRFAALGSLALRNAELIAGEREAARVETELAESMAREDMRQETIQAVIRAQEEERRRIARELHDAGGQALASILLGLKVASQEPTVADMRARLADLREVAATAAGDLRRLALELRPSVLDDLGLVAALERLLTDTEEHTELEVVADLELGDDRLGPEVETIVYRVAQEATTNAAKYAGAATVTVELRRVEDVVRLVVTDTGRGFDAESVADKGLGLRGMHERAGLVGGKIDVRSTPGEGTKVSLEIPVGGEGP